MPNESNNQESIISVSIIDYIGKMEDGVALLLSVKIFDQMYEVAYWFNRKGLVRIVPEEKMLNKLGVTNIYDYDNLEELVHLIHSNIPKVDKILDEFIEE
jgi:hypothetical protein